MVREVGRNGFLQKVSICLYKGESGLTVIPAFLPLSLLLLVSSISVSRIKPKSDLLLSNNLNVGMFGRGSRIAAINILGCSMIYEKLYL